MSEKLNVWQYIKHYKFNSLFFRSFVLVMLLSFLPLAAISSFVYHYNDSIMREEIGRGALNDLTRTRDIVDIILSEMEILAVRIGSNPDVDLFFRSDLSYPAEYQSVMRTHRIQQVLQTSKVTSSYIDSILLYSDKNEYVLSLESAGRLEVYDSAWWKPSYERRKKDTAYWEKLLKEEAFYPSSKPLLGFFRHADSGDGVIIINVDIQALGELVNGDACERSLALIDRERRLLYHRDSSRFNTLLADTEPELDAFIREEALSQIADFADGEKVVAVIPSTFRKDWTFISVASLQQFEEQRHHLQQLIVWLGAASALTAILLAFVIAIKNYRPIQKILSLVDNKEHAMMMMEDDSDGNWNETKHILQNISRTYRQSEELDVQLRDKYQMLRKAQAVALQAQINPHFLYNTFDAICWKAMQLTGGKNDASAMIQSLSRLLRLSLDTREDMIPISKELEHVRLYLEIQKIRYRDKLQFKMNVNDNAMQYKIIKLVLQPLVENAIYHGIKPNSDGGLITITAYEKAGAVIIRVKDNGQGMPRAMINRLNADFRKEPTMENTQIGLLNVNQRIQLAFGPEYRLYIRSKEQVGTIVEMIIPKINGTL